MKSCPTWTPDVVPGSRARARLRPSEPIRLTDSPGFKNISCYLLGERALALTKSRVNPIANHRLTLDLWLAKDNRFLNPKSSYKRILMAPPCRLIQNQLLTLVPVFDWQLILMESRLWCHHPFVTALGGDRLVTHGGDVGH